MDYLINKLFTKGLLFIAIFSLFALKPAFSQTITVGTVDPGPYAGGSTIAVPITVSGTCVNPNTTYNLYLSDATGSFATPTLIGSFNDFYAIFVNGVIPAGLPASNTYKVEVVSVNPAVTSSASAPFSINAGAGVTAGVTSQNISPGYTEVFGNCVGSSNTVFSFVDSSTPGSTVSAAFFNELTQASEGTITPTATGTSFTANAAQYIITVKAANAGIIGTKAYLLINNTVNTSFGVTGSNSVCLAGGGGLLVYNVDTSSPNGIQNNFPGLIYNINWGDGNTSQYTLCDILASGGKISHVYKKSSCGNSPNSQNNSFEVDFQPTDQYCNKVGTQVTSYAKVFTAPKNRFNSPIAACVNTPVSFDNISDPGQDPNNTQSTCAAQNALYTWIVDGTTVATNYKLTQNLINTFTTTGIHNVTLHLQNSNSLCLAVDTTISICIQNPPQPKFTLPLTTACLPLTLTPTNQSVIDSNCNNTNQYLWTATGPGPVSFANGTNGNSAQPQFVFKNPGVYSIQLGISTVSCGTITAPVQTVNVDSTAAAKLSPDTTLCQSNQTLAFSPAKGPTQSFLLGNAQNIPGTYLWTVTGGNYTYQGGTSDTSRYPQINFTDLATYTVTVTNTNICGPPATATQHITFQQAPTVSAGPDQTFCANKPAQLNGTITGKVQSFQWVGGGGVFTPGRNTLTPTYTPTTAEINAGTVTLSLQATTLLPAPCNIIISSVNLSITKPDSITSPPTFSGCSGVPINYQVTAVLPNSTFTWVVDPAKTSASASGYAANGTGTTITDAIVNSDPVNYTTVTYDITAIGGTGCSSNTFVLTVTIAPKQAIAKFTQDVTAGCDNVKVTFTNQSVPANSTFTWSFGDGTVSAAVNPVHTFAPRTDGKDTTYTITLNTLAQCGNSVPFTSTVLVRPKTPVAFISPQQIQGCSPFTLTVDNFSPGTNQSYTFYLYNGPTLVQQIVKTDKSSAVFNPVAVTTTKQYTLYMVATGFCGTTAQSNIIPISISASNVIAQMFVANGTNKGCAPLTVNFINNSLGGDTYYYTIYDANNNVVDKVQGGAAPLPYTFNTPGTFYVTITAVNSCFTAESAPKIRMDVYGLPSPLFAADVTTGCKNVLVSLANQTPNDVNTQATSLAYEWNFGDGSPHSFTFTPPPHNYNYKKSPYTVTLTATNLVTGCSNVFTRTTYININAPTGTEFTETPDSVTSIPNYHFTFNDETTGGPVSWKWDFGDGKTSTSQNPGHTYIDTGKYKVTLTTVNALGCDSTVSHFVRITGVPGQLFFPNAFEPDGGTVALKTFMAKGSGIREWHMQVFNNFSQLVWETTKLDSKGAPVDGWDGTFKGAPAPQGVYIWQASATFINGTEWKGNTYNNSTPKRTGPIHLIR